MVAACRRGLFGIGSTFILLVWSSVLASNAAVGVTSGDRSPTPEGIVALVSTSHASMTSSGEIVGVTSAITSDRGPAARTEGTAPTQFASRRGQAVPPAPSPTYEFSTGSAAGTTVSIGGSPADSNVAASRTHICLTTRAALACYTKGGALVNLGTGFDARPYTAQEFFTKSGISIGSPFNGVGSTTKDGRVVFDQSHRRFFMSFQSRESQGRLLIAVSKSEDPRDGWWTYADLVANAQANQHDYQKIGISSAYFLISDIMKNCVLSGGSWTCANSGTRNFMYTAADLVAGKPYTRLEWSNPAAGRAAPCVNDSATTDAYWVTRDDDTHASVWGVRNGAVTRQQVAVKTSTSAVDGVQLGGDSVSYTNIGRSPQNAQYRDNRIVWVSNDGHTWSRQAQPSNAVRLVRLNVSQFYAQVPSVTVEIDRIFGRASASDPAGAVFDYGWPAVAANGVGDIVVGSVRSNSTIYPNLRASVWFAGQSDISSSISLKSSSSKLSQFHMAGASDDPITDGVYLSQQYGSSSPSWRVRVIKMLGSVSPDIIATKIQAPGSVKHGKSGTASVTVMNQGDKAMPASAGDLRLSANNLIDTSDTLLLTFSVPALSPNEQATIDMEFTIPKNQSTGLFYIGAMLDRNTATTENSETNNENPFLAGDHGNVPITVT
jgi:hypothetical protein